MREYHLHSLLQIAAAHPLVLVDRAVPPWARPYLAGEVTASLSDPGEVTAAVGKFLVDHSVGGLVTYEPRHARLAAHLGLPGNSPAAVATCQAPARARHVLREADVPSMHSPNQLGNAFEDLVETGGKKEGQRLAPTKEFTKIYTNRTKVKEASFATVKHFDGKPAHPKVYALRLADGGVLALFPSAYTIEYLHKRFMNGGRIIPGPAEAVYNSEQRPLITDEYQGQALATLTPTGKPKVLTHRYTMVNSR
ncbi:hypothetical protein [Streptomyces sp. GESEQ-4]|uniref:hypothetical protein n=1 Tax=Streptomyces sp. GESEQ-4 TaxID=2812655 RepID=UPI001B320CE6|nr:hypothetical protein [Streptomyces sp. GESEQ-4]